MHLGPQLFDFGPQPSILGPQQQFILLPRAQELVVFVTLAPRSYRPTRVTRVGISIATRVNVIIGAVIVVVDTIGPLHKTW